MAKCKFIVRDHSENITSGEGKSLHLNGHKITGTHPIELSGNRVKNERLSMSSNGILIGTGIFTFFYPFLILLLHFLHNIF